MNRPTYDRTFHPSGYLKQLTCYIPEMNVRKIVEYYDNGAVKRMEVCLFDVANKKVLATFRTNCNGYLLEIGKLNVTPERRARALGMLEYRVV